MSVTRRNLLVLGAIAAAIAVAQRSNLAGRLRPAPDLNFIGLDDPPGYRRLPGGPVSAATALFAGLGDQAPAPLVAARAEVDRDLCGTLHSTVTAPGTVPVAYFYDYQCPICRRLSPRLRDLPGITLTWHDLASLGVASDLAARAAIAARAQGAFDAFHDRMMRAVFQPTDGYISALAESVGIDAKRLLADMAAPEVTRQMNRSRALSDRFGMPGTPGLVIGRTLVIGDVDDKTLNRIIALEAAAPGPCG